MKKLFKPDERVYVRGVPEEVKNAILARFEADGWRPYCNAFGHIRLTSQSSGDVTNITIEDCLFRGAPDWAVDVRKINSEYCWTDEARSICYFNGVDISFKHLPAGKVIYTRKPVDVEKPWHEIEGALPPLGEECEISYNMSRTDYPENYSDYKKGYIAGKDRGELWIRFCDGENKTLISTECKFRPIQPPKKINMKQLTEQERRDELLQVATQLAAGILANPSDENMKWGCERINSDAIKFAKDLIGGVNQEFSECRGGE